MLHLKHIGFKEILWSDIEAATGPNGEVVVLPKTAENLYGS